MLPDHPLRPEPVDDALLATVGLDESALDRSADPCTDFYQFACGGWIAQTEIPSDKSRWVRSFSEIHQRNEQDLKAILEGAAAAESPGSPLLAKLGAFYGGCMDTAAVDKAGLASVQTVLDTIDKLDRQGGPEAALPGEAAGGASGAEEAGDGGSAYPLERVVGELHRLGVWVLFDVDSGQDFKDATKMIAVLDQNGLGLPDRDMYLKEDESAQKLRDTYVGHVARMLQLAGASAPEAAKSASAIMALETEIAKISKTRVERRDPEGMYNKIDRAGLTERNQAFNWDAYFAWRKLDGITELSVTSIPFVEGIGTAAQGVDDATLRTYLRWHVLQTFALQLPKRFADESFKMTQALSGQETQRDRWKRCISATDHYLGEMLAQPFLEQRFSPQSKQAVIDMVGGVSAAFGANLAGISWMDDTTRGRARAKLDKMAFLIGYPDEWKKSYDFPVNRAVHIDNVLAARTWKVAYELAKIGKPVDRGVWYMTPPTVNAYYDPTKNQMVYPAGILQPPFYNSEATLAVNLGAMGMVVGHELTHGFDDQGSQFDGDGNLSGWWEPEVRGKFDELTACVDKQYSTYDALPGVKLNGKLTLGENIADIGGVKLAYAAYKNLSKASGVKPLIAGGMTTDQHFFVSLGQVWCAKYREKEARLRAQVDPHSPPMWRINGTLRNVTEFAQAFQCESGSTMAPTDACAVW